MSVEYVLRQGPDVFVTVCLSSDTKPSPVVADNICIERDTGKIFVASAGAWVDVTNITLSAVNTYRTLLDSTGSHIAGRVPGIYGFAHGQPLALAGTGTLYALNTIFIAAAEYPQGSKLCVRAQCYTNNVAPGGNYTIGLHPITRPVSSGGAGQNIYNIGPAAGVSVAFTNPAADGLFSQVGADFSPPAEGHYVLGCVTTATVATAAHIHFSAQLQMRNN